MYLNEDEVDQREEIDLDLNVADDDDDNFEYEDLSVLSEIAELPILDLYTVLSGVDIMKQVKDLIKKVRLISKSGRRMNIIYSYIKNYINKQPKESNLDKINGLIIDMPIRWGSTKNMITRFLLLEGPIRVLTEKPQQIPAFDDKQQNHFKKLKLSELEWLVLRIIDRNLSKFSDATMVLSGRSYHTLSLSSVILKRLNDHFRERLVHNQDDRLIQKRLIEFENEIKKRVFSY